MGPFIHLPTWLSHCIRVTSSPWATAPSSSCCLQSDKGRPSPGGDHLLQATACNPCSTHHCAKHPCRLSSLCAAKHSQWPLAPHACHYVSSHLSRLTLITAYCCAESLRLQGRPRGRGETPLYCTMQNLHCTQGPVHRSPCITWTAARCRARHGFLPHRTQARAASLEHCEDKVTAWRRQVAPKQEPQSSRSSPKPSVASMLGHDQQPVPLQHPATRPPPAAAGPQTPSSPWAAQGEGAS